MQRTKHLSAVSLYFGKLIDLNANVASHMKCIVDSTPAITADCQLPSQDGMQFNPPQTLLSTSNDAFFRNLWQYRGYHILRTDTDGKRRIWQICKQRLVWLPLGRNSPDLLGCHTWHCLLIKAPGVELSNVKGTGLDGFSSPLLFHLETFSTTPTLLDISLYNSQIERIMPIYSFPNEREETQQCKNHNISMNKSTLSCKHQGT